MKKIITVFALVCFLLPFQLKATHVSGGEVTYTYLGSNQYKVQLVLYWDCGALATLGPTALMTATNTCGLGTINFTATRDTVFEVSQVCPGSLNSTKCNGGTLPGNKKNVYSAIVTLPGACNNWTFEHTSGDRNQSNNLLGNTNAYCFYAKVNNSTATGNNSPFFTSQPLPYLCVGQQVCYSPGVVELDGDILSYSFVSAMTTTPTNPVPYSAGYTGAVPMPGISIDPVTGLITFTPSTIGNFVVCFLVEERNSSGVVIGSVIRDIQMVVVNCSNQVISCNAGTISNLTGFGATVTGSNSISICENNPFSFEASFTDPDAANILSYTSNILTVLPGATITSTGTNPITLTVSWTAPSGSANTNTTFALTVSDNACPVTGQQTVNYIIEVLPPTYAGPDQIICGNQSAQLNAVGPGTSFTWSVLTGPPMVIGTNFSCNPCQSPQASPSSTTTYLLTSNGGNGCVLTDTVTITRVPDFSFNTTQSTVDLCLQQSVQFEVTGSPAGTYSYLWSPSSNLDNTTIFNPTATLNAAGPYSYFLNITSPDGCLKRDTVSVNVLPFIRTIANPDTILCLGQSANLSAAGGTSFTWSVFSGPPLIVGTNISCINCANPVATPLSTTTYIVTSDLTGTCINTDTVTVFVVPDFIITTSQSDSTTCLGSTVQITTSINPSGSYDYWWSPSTYLNDDSIPNPIATITAPGTHTFVNNITNSQGCVKLDTTVINVTPSYPPVPTLSYTSAACLGDSIMLDASFGDGIPAVCGINPVGCSASVIGTVGSGSSANTNMTYPAPYGNWWTSVRQQYLYTAAELNAAGITGGKIDQIDFNVNAINGISTYHFFTIGMACTNLTSFPSSATDFELGIINVFPSSTYNVTTGWNAHPFNGSFEWDGISNIIVDICFNELNPSSNYTNNSIVAIDATGYTSTIYSTSDVTQQCSGAPVIGSTMSHPQIRFHYCSGAPDLTNFIYSWSPSVLLNQPNAQSTAAFVPGNTTYTLVVTDNLSGCVDSSSLTVNAIAPTTFNMTVGNDVTICPGAPTTLSASGATTYLWSPSTGLSSPTSANPVASPMSTTTYTVTGSTPCAPSITDSVTVTAVNSVILNVDAGNDITICPGASTTLNATGATNYVWSPGTSLSSTTVANPIASPINSITYTVTGTAFCANPVVDSVTITTDNSVILNVSAGNNVTICPGTPTTLNATGATTYSWTPPTALSSTSIANPVASPSTTTTYTVTGTAFCADPVSSTVTVTAVNSVILNVNAGNDTAVCPGMPTVLTASGATNYIWSPSTGLSTTIGASTISSPLATITYTVTGSGPCANPVQDSITVNVLTAAQLNVSAGADGAVCVGDPINLSAATSGGYSGNFYEWSVLVGSLTDSISNSHSLNAYVSTTVEGVNIYEITVTDLCGNIASDTVIYDVSSGCELTVPNIFTPNGDGNNDVFVVSGKGVSSFSISIFNRWGKKVYESSDISEAWTGGGNEDGTYFYVVQGRSRNGNDLTSKGYIQLLSK
jgi:gliding motility-associated-like protein